MNNKKINNRGIALLFSIILSAIFLSITLGVMNITLKELNFSTSSKNTNNAFYAADSGIECALFNDKIGSLVFTEKNESKIACFGPDNIYTLKSNFGELTQEYSFNVSGLGSNGNSCVKVTVLKNLDKTTEPPGVTSTKITSKGYSVGGEDDCSSDVFNRVERQLETNY